MCCEYYGVPEVDNAPHSACRHQCEAGCELHGLPQQPEMCRTFQCAWLKGVLNAEFRPEIVGWFGKAATNRDNDREVQVVNVCVPDGQITPAVACAARKGVVVVEPDGQVHAVDADDANTYMAAHNEVARIRQALRSHRS